MSKCECCKEENSDLITYKGYKMCPACYMGYVRKVKVCENNAKYETEIDQLKQQLEIQSSVLKQTREKLSKAEHDRDRYRDKIKEQQEQLDHQETMWNELKEFVNKKDLEYYSTLNNIGFNDKSSKFLFAKYNFCGEIKNKIKELEKGSADGNIK